MQIEDIISGAFGTGGVALVVAVALFFFRRMLLKYDEKTAKTDDLVSQIKDSIGEVRVDLGIVKTKVEVLSKTIDRMNDRNGK